MSVDKQAEENARIEKEYAAMIKAEGTDKKSTPEYKVTNTLNIAQKAVTKALDTINADNKLSALVDIDKLGKIDVTKLSKVKEQEADTEGLANSRYTGSNVEIYQWQHSILASPKKKRSSGDSSPFNILSETAKPTAEKVLGWVKNNVNKSKKEIKEAVSSLIRPEEYGKYITVKDGEAQNDKIKKLQNKVELIISKLSGPQDKLKGIDKIGEKLEQDKGKYKVSKVD